MSQAAKTQAQANKQRAKAKREQAKAAKVERARLDKLGAAYVCKNDVEPDLNRLAVLLKSGRLVASSRETRGPLHMLRTAIDTNQQFLGPVAEALARAIAASPLPSCGWA